MEHLPPSGWGDVARRSDLDHLERALRTDMESMRVELRGEIAELRGELRGAVGELRGELRGAVGELRGEMAKQTRIVLVGMGSMVASVMAALTVAVLSFGH